MDTAIEANIIKQLHRLDERRKAEVLDFVEYLTTKSGETSLAADWPEIDPSRDLAKYIGVATGLPEDGVAYQRQVRDTEWP